MFYVGPIILDDHVGALGEAFENRDAFRILEVERQAALIAMQVLKVGAMA